MGERKIGYIVKIDCLNLYNYEHEAIASVVGPYLRVIGGVKKKNPAWHEIMEYLQDIGCRGSRYCYIPILFTDNMAIQIVHELNNRKIDAQYIAYDAKKDTYLMEIQAVPKILYSHISMDTMERYSVNADEKEIVTYLRSILKLEGTLLAIKKCKSKVNKIHQNRKPRNESRPEYQIREKEVSSVGRCVGIGAVSGIAGAVVIPFVLAFICDILHLTRDELGGGTEVFWKIGGILAILLGVVTFIAGLVKRKKDIAYNANARKMAKKRKKEEVKEDDNHIDPLKKLNECQNLVQSTLNALYNEDVIVSKYRSLIPVAEFYDYMTHKNAKITKLSGDAGAYALYEENLNNRTILGNLNMLEDNLPGWIENQPVECGYIKDAVNISICINQSGKLDKLVKIAESDCKLIMEEFEKYKKNLELYK